MAYKLCLGLLFKEMRSTERAIRSRTPVKSGISIIASSKPAIQKACCPVNIASRPNTATTWYCIFSSFLAMCSGRGAIATSERRT